MFNTDCSTPFTNTHPSVIITIPDEFVVGDISIQTDNAVEGHEVVSFCIIATYHGYVGTIGVEANYSPTSYTRVVTFRICEDYITMDTSKDFYYE